MDSHALHRLLEFLPHLAERRPELLSMLPSDEQPREGESLMDWVLGFQQSRLMEICSLWVLESLRILREKSPLSNVLIRGCLLLGGEFDLDTAAAVSIGEVPPSGDPRREEIRLALRSATRIGVLLHLNREERYCLPFPVRLSFEGVEFVDPLERETIRLRIIAHYAEFCRARVDLDEIASSRAWQFPNLLVAYEMTVDLMEESLGVDAEEWLAEGDRFASVPDSLIDPLLLFARYMGRALVMRETGAVTRLLRAGAAAARTRSDLAGEARVLELLGQFQLSHGEHANAVKSYLRCEKVQFLLGNPEAAVLCVSAVALAHREMEAIDLAIADFLRACQFAHDHQMFEQEIDTANCASDLMIEEGRTQEVIDLLERVIESQSRSARVYAAKSELLLHLAVALRREGREDAARRHLQAALAIAREAIHRPAEAAVHLELASHEREAASALPRVERALELYTEMGNHQGMARACRAISVLRRASGEDREECDRMLARALRFAQDAKDHSLEADILRERALACMETGDRQNALTSISREVVALRKTRFIPRLIDAHLRAASIYLSLDSHLAAAAEVLRAQALQRTHGHVSPEAIESLLRRCRASLTPEQFEYLVHEVSEELEGGILKG